MMLFILFAAWFSGNTLSMSQYPTFLVSGLLSFFGSVNVAIPFMLDLMKLPADLFQLYVVTGVLNGRFSTLLAAMNLVIFTLLSTAWLTGVISISKKKLITYVVVSLLLTGAVIGACRAYFHIAVRNEYEKDKVINNMQSLVYPMPRVIHKTTADVVKMLDLSKPALQRIRESGVLRVGYLPGNLPFTYFGETGELVGFDIDMAQLLAQELKVNLEFIPFQSETMVEQLDAGCFDLIMSGTVITTPRLEKMVFSDPYVETTLAFIVPDYRRDEFSTRKALQKISKLKIGIPASVSDYFLGKMKNYLPQAEIVEVKSIREYFESNGQQLDALLFDAESGSAWTLLFPKFQAVVPIPDISKIPRGYPVAGHDQEFADFLSQWITLKKDGLEYSRLYNHWILGLEAVPERPRWSIIRDVLKWVK
jgi:ABC-type amino acid transport substrate-binding protein